MIHVPGILKAFGASFPLAAHSGDHASRLPPVMLYTSTVATTGFARKTQSYAGIPCAPWPWCADAAAGYIVIAPVWPRFYEG
jgi:hypothetical protein